MSPDFDSQPAMGERRSARAIVMGASAGALDALSGILPALPRGYPLPVMIVVHLPADKKSCLAELQQSKCQVAVREADDKKPIRAGTVYFAPPDYHLLIEADGRLSLSSEEPVQYSRPSIDILFESAADVYGSELVGIVLTGANNDGARGLQAIEAAGGTVLVQDPESAFSGTMPRAAIDACASALILGLPKIAAFLKESITSVSS